MSIQIRQPIEFSTAEEATTWALNLFEKQEYKGHSQVEAMININNISLAILMPLKEEANFDLNIQELKELSQNKNIRIVAPIVACLEDSRSCLEMGRTLAKLLQKHCFTASIDASWVKIGSTVCGYDDCGGIGGIAKEHTWTKGFLPPSPHLSKFGL
ncbi:MAG: hypothetical protein VX777_00020 [Chlamydiota bacterium]|nr:hypothetical protein [Chlamydiota bacterium]